MAEISKGEFEFPELPQDQMESAERSPEVREVAESIEKASLKPEEVIETERDIKASEDLEEAFTNVMEAAPALTETDEPLEVTLNTTSTYTGIEMQKNDTTIAGDQYQNDAGEPQAASAEGAITIEQAAELAAIIDSNDGVALGDGNSQTAEGINTVNQDDTSQAMGIIMEDKPAEDGAEGIVLQNMPATDSIPGLEGPQGMADHSIPPADGSFETAGPAAIIDTNDGVSAEAIIDTNDGTSTEGINETDQNSQSTENSDTETDPTNAEMGDPDDLGVGRNLVEDSKESAEEAVKNAEEKADMADQAEAIANDAVTNAKEAQGAATKVAETGDQTRAEIAQDLTDAAAAEAEDLMRLAETAANEAAEAEYAAKLAAGLVLTGKFEEIGQLENQIIKLESQISKIENFITILREESFKFGKWYHKQMNSFISNPNQDASYQTFKIPHRVRGIWQLQEDLYRYPPGGLQDGSVDYSDAYAEQRTFKKKVWAMNDDIDVLRSEISDLKEEIANLKEEAVTEAESHIENEG